MRIHPQWFWLGVVLALSGCATPPPTADPPPPQLIGTWLGTDDKDKQGVITLLSDGTARLTVEESLGPPTATSPSEIIYHVNSQSSPWEIGFLITQRDGRKRIMRGLVQLLDQNTIQIAFVDGWNTPLPKSFAEVPPNDKMTFRRVAH